LSFAPHSWHTYEPLSPKEKTINADLHYWQTCLFICGFSFIVSPPDRVWRSEPSRFLLISSSGQRPKARMSELRHELGGETVRKFKTRGVQEL
jgi:hypothetical protein